MGANLDRVLNQFQPRTPNFHQNFLILVPHNLEDSESQIPHYEDLFCTAFGIKYTDVKGISSTRRISARAIKDNCIIAYCYERKAIRSFRIDRISAFIDMHTGEIFTPNTGIINYLAGLDFSENLSPQKKALSRAGDGIKLLFWLAQSDGFVHDEEIQVVYSYCDKLCYDIDGYDLDRLIGWGTRQFPDHLIIKRCLSKLKDTENTRLIKNSIHSLIDADGILAKGEMEAVMEIEQLI